MTAALQEHAPSTPQHRARRPRRARRIRRPRRRTLQHLRRPPTALDVPSWLLARPGPRWLHDVDASPELSTLRGDGFATARAFAEVLAHGARPDGTSAPTHALIADRIGRSHDTVTRLAAMFVRAGLLHVLEEGSSWESRGRKPTDTAGNRAKVYVLTVRAAVVQAYPQRLDESVDDIPQPHPGHPVLLRPPDDVEAALEPPTRPRRTSSSSPSRPPRRGQLRRPATPTTRPSVCPVDEDASPLSHLSVREKTNPTPPNPPAVPDDSPRLRREGPGVDARSAGRLAARVQRRAQKLAEHEQQPHLEELLAAPRPRLRAALRAHNLAGLSIEQVLHALRFAPDGTAHLTGTAPRDPAGVLWWRLWLWGAHLRTVPTERAFTDLNHRQATLDAVRARRQAEAVEREAAAAEDAPGRVAVRQMLAARRAAQGTIHAPRRRQERSA